MRNVTDEMIKNTLQIYLDAENPNEVFEDAPCPLCLLFCCEHDGCQERVIKYLISDKKNCNFGYIKNTKMSRSNYSIMNIKERKKFLKAVKKAILKSPYFAKDKKHA